MNPVLSTEYARSKGTQSRLLTGSGERVKKGRKRAIRKLTSTLTTKPQSAEHSTKHPNDTETESSTLSFLVPGPSPPSTDTAWHPICRHCLHPTDAATSATGTAALPAATSFAAWTSDTRIDYGMPAGMNTPPSVKGAENFLLQWQGVGRLDYEALEKRLERLGIKATDYRFENSFSPALLRAIEKNRHRH